MSLPSQLADPAAPALLGGIVATAMLGGWATKIDRWYRDLAKPSWQPPDWVFPVVWTLVFACTGIALLRAWPLLAGGWRTALVGIAVMNAVANIGWSVLFFRRHRPDLALWGCLPLLATIAGLLVVCAHADAIAGLCIVPYLAWVTIATRLNAVIVTLNAPATRVVVSSPGDR